MSLLTEEEAQAKYQQAIGRIVAAPYERRDVIADEEARQVDSEIAVQALKRQMLAQAREQARRLEREKEKPVIGDVQVSLRSEDSGRFSPSQQSVFVPPQPRRASVGRSLAAEIQFMATGEWTEELLDSTFSLRSGRSVVWREAAKAEVRERREMFEDQLNRAGEGISLCDKALKEFSLAPKAASLGEALRLNGRLH